MGKERLRGSIIATILLGTTIGIGAGSLNAYMTSQETATNTFTAGEVKINLQEPAWKPEDGKYLVAKMTFSVCTIPT